MTTVFLVNNNAELAKSLDMAKSENASCLARVSLPTGSPIAALEIVSNAPKMIQNPSDGTRLPTRSVDPVSQLADANQNAAQNLSAIQQDGLRQVLQTLHQASLEQNKPLESDISPFGSGGWKPVKP